MIPACKKDARLYLSKKAEKLTIIRKISIYCLLFAYKTTTCKQWAFAGFVIDFTVIRVYDSVYES